MDYLILAISLVGAYHAYTFAKWLRQQGNRLGAIGVAVIITVSVALPLYRIIAKKLS